MDRNYLEYRNENDEKLQEGGVGHRSCYTQDLLEREESCVRTKRQDTKHVSDEVVTIGKGGHYVEASEGSKRFYAD
jgi:hypothetical protein